MDDREREELISFRQHQAELRERQWVRTILKARKFKRLETLQQGLSFSEDVEKLRRGWHLGRS